MTKPNEPNDALERLRRLGLWGVIENYDQIKEQPWLQQVLAFEEASRHRRSLERRTKNARLGTLKSMVDFDWAWPKSLDRELIAELLGLEFADEGANIVIIGPNGVGKTMLAKNLVHAAIIRGHTARFTTASDMLSELAAQDSETSLARRLRRYTRPKVLAIDELGYLSYDARYADLLFEVITRRYEAEASVILTTNLPFERWPTVFPNATCVVTLVDRLMHKAEIIQIDADSYRLREAQERKQTKSLLRKNKTKPPPKS